MKYKISLSVGELPKFTPKASTNNVNIWGETDLYFWDTNNAKGVFKSYSSNNSNASEKGGAKYGHIDFNSNHTHSITVNEIGGDIPHNNVSPYKAAYVWIRIA